MLRRGKIRIKKEVLTAIAETIGDSFRRDKKDFSAYFPKLDINFYSQFRKHLEEVKTLPNPINLTRELLHYIEEMHEYLISVTPLLDSPDFSAAKTEQFNHPIHQTISILKKRVKRNDISGTIKYLDELIEIVRSIRMETGDRIFEQKVLDELISHRDNLQGDHFTIKSLLKRRSLLLDKNDKSRDRLRDDIYRISRAGKNMYRTMKSEKLKDYDILELIRKQKLATNNK